MYEQLIMAILKVLCPRLRDMAARTENKIDDLVVGIICGMVSNHDSNNKS